MDNAKVTNIKKPSRMVNDLMSMIKLSQSAKDLMEGHIFRFNLDSSFKLTVLSEARATSEEEAGE